MKVKDHYIKLVQSSAATDRRGIEIANQAAQRVQDEELFELDDEDDTQVGLPQKFSELTDDHFPLFLTFDKVRPHSLSSRISFLSYLLALSAT